MEAALRLVHLAAGVSYYKAAAPARIVVETGPLTRAEEGLVRDLYDKGLREFAVANELAVPLGFELTAGPGLFGGGKGGGPGGVNRARGGSPSRGRRANRRREDCDRAGGGSQSGGARQGVPELSGRDQQPPCDGTDRSGSRPAARLDSKDHLTPVAGAQRGRGANGHVPITAIVSLLAVAAGYLYGYDTTLMALERSADEATALVGDAAVNHQWSKSTECELELRSVIRESVSSSIEYCSGLRSCGELEIARWFADLPAYHAGFRSCNQAYRPGARFDAWCGRCPKCRFVFLMLAPFLEPDRLETIFGHNLLDEVDQTEGFWDLSAAGRKPYECVGEQRESLLAFLLVLDKPAWRGFSVVQALRSEIEACRALVSSDLGGGVPVIESAEVTRERVVRLITEVVNRDRPSRP